MTPVIPCSANSSSFIPGTAFTRRSRFLLRFSVSGKSTKTLSSSRVVLPRLSSASVVPQFRSECAQHHISRIHRLLATGTDVAVDEQESPIADEDSPGPPKEPSPSLETNEDSSVKSGAAATSTRSKRSRPARKSDMPPIQNEDLVPGTMFTGKVRSIQPFGAFVDFGAFTDGLVHVSRLSDSFVKDVGSVVSIGQEVKVRLVEVNIETGRISLSMRENGDSSKPQQRKEAVSGSEKARPGRRSTSKSTPNKDQAKKSSKFVKGQDLVGTVKNKVRSGSFISLPEGEEGFLPASEESDEVMWNMTGGSSLEVGQEVNVRVLRVSRGQVTLTMKKEEDAEKLDAELNQGVVHVATNPFVLAFRKNSDIAAFLDERKKMDETAQISEKRETPGEVEGSTKQAETARETPELHGQSVAFYESVASVPAAADDVTDNKDISVLADDDKEAIEVEDASKEIPNSKESKDSSVSNKLHSLDGAVQISKEEALEAEVVAMITNDKVQITSPVAEPSNDTKSYYSGDTVDQAFSLDRAFTEEIPAVNQAETDLATDEVEIPSSTAESDIPVVPSTEDGDKVDQISSSYSVVSEEIAETNQTETNLANDDVEMPVVPSTEDGDKVDQISPSDSVVVEEIAATNQAESGFAKDDIKISSSTVEGDIPAALSAEDGAKVDQISSSGSLVSKEFVEENQIEDAKRNEVVQMQTAISGNDPQAEKQLVTTLPEKNGTFTSLNGEIDGVSSQGSITRDKLENDGKADPGDAAFSQILSSQSHDQADSNISKGELEIQLPAAESKISSAIPNGNDNAKAYEKDANVTNSSGPTDVPTSGESTPKATISPALVKQLREETGAGMMDCKRALSETGGDVIKAQEYLRKKGLASAEKKASRATSEGRIGSYIHDSKIGVLIEVNCETDFVSRGEIFKELVDDLAMQVAACPQVRFLVTEDVPKEITDKEREIEMQKEDLLSKPEQIREKIVEGRIRKRLEELALFEQQYIKNDKVLVKDWIKQTIATIGENIKVKRFVRYNLGEGLEKKSQDFAAEVAAQTAAKPLTTPEKTQPAATETQKQEEKTSTVTVSASLVKKLREGTGAGMMDCKRALSETGGDLEKAQEYLRKKGLSTADKKSSRLAAEGRIGSYIHDSRIGVLIEINCETDFVGRSEKFKELVDDLAMQVVACPQVQFVTIEGIPENIVSKEKEIEMQREDVLSKPENIRGRIVEGRISNRLGELALLEQPFIKNDSILVKDLVKQTIASLGENIKVRRFVRFILGEELEISKTEPES